jgi:hypothetical protein
VDADQVLVAAITGEAYILFSLDVSRLENGIQLYQEGLAITQRCYTVNSVRSDVKTADINTRVECT